jgi:hypothetical protein
VWVKGAGTHRKGWETNESTIKEWKSYTHPLITPLLFPVPLPLPSSYLPLCTSLGAERRGWERKREGKNKRLEMD